MVLSKKRTKKFIKNNNKTRRRKNYRGGSLDLDSIKKLSELKDNHMITAEEYIEAKKQILKPNTSIDNNTPINNVNTSSNSKQSSGIMGLLSKLTGGMLSGSGQGLMTKGIGMAISAATFPARMMINTALSLFGHKAKDEINNSFQNQVIDDNNNQRNNSMNNIEPGAPSGGAKQSGGQDCVSGVKNLSNQCSDPNQLLNMHDAIVKKLKNTSKGFFTDNHNKAIDNLNYLDNQKGGRYLTKKNRKHRIGNNKSQKNIKKINIIVYNINYWDKDGSKIVDNIGKFHTKYPEYKYTNGQTGSYGFHKIYMIPKNKLNQFKKDTKIFYTSLKIKDLKIKYTNNINPHLYLLDQEI